MEPEALLTMKDVEAWILVYRTWGGGDKKGEDDDECQGLTRQQQ